MEVMQKKMWRKGKQNLFIIIELKDSLPCRNADKLPADM
jgi:hypothetical protein